VRAGTSTSRAIGDTLATFPAWAELIPAAVGNDRVATGIPARGGCGAPAATASGAADGLTGGQAQASQ
jgi:hypothetical protein